jgi:hypothetical protein
MEEEFTYEVKVRDMSQFIVSDEELKKDEERMNSLCLEKKVKINGKIMKTYGEIKKYLNKIEHIEKMENYLEESDYIYLYNWLQFKLMGKIY